MLAYNNFKIELQQRMTSEPLYWTKEKQFFSLIVHKLTITSTELEGFDVERGPVLVFLLNFPLLSESYPKSWEITI